MEQDSVEYILQRLREELDKIYVKYEGHPLIEKDDITGGIESIITDYYEYISPM